MPAATGRDGLAGARREQRRAEAGVIAVAAQSLGTLIPLTVLHAPTQLAASVSFWGQHTAIIAKPTDPGKRPFGGSLHPLYPGL